MPSPVLPLLGVQSQQRKELILWAQWQQTLPHKAGSQAYPSQDSYYSQRPRWLCPLFCCSREAKVLVGGVGGCM